MSGARLAASALTRLLPADRRGELLADLDEEMLALSAKRGRHTADRWYAAQLLRSIGPLAGRWLELKLLAALPTKPPSIGQAFFAFVVSWFALVVWTMPRDAEQPHALSTQSSGWQPSAVILEDGGVHLVYSLSDRPEEQNDPQPDLPVRFLLLAFVPPAILFAGLLLVLPILDARDRRRRAVRA